MPAASLSRDEVVELILAAFRQYGYEGASLVRLSQATGLGRSSLYHYFPKGKEDMAHAAMAAVSAWFGANLIAPLRGTEPPSQRLQRFAGKLSEFYQGGERACLMDVFTIGEAGLLFQRHLRERLLMLVQALAQVIEETGVERTEALRRAENAVIALEGSLIVSRALATTAPFLRTMKELPEQLLRD